MDGELLKALNRSPSPVPELKIVANKIYDGYRISSWLDKTWVIQRIGLHESWHNIEEPTETVEESSRILKSIILANKNCEI